MLRKLQESKQKRDEGFTLIELLVVVIIIGILAAIAIPVFLAQREKAWDAAAKSDLRNAAVAQESYYTGSGAYADVVANLEAEGFKGSDTVTFVVASGTTTGYCMEAKHDSSAQWWHLNSNVGAPAEGQCA